MILSGSTFLKVRIEFDEKKVIDSSIGVGDLFLLYRGAIVNRRSSVILDKLHKPFVRAASSTVLIGAN